MYYTPVSHLPSIEIMAVTRRRSDLTNACNYFQCEIFEFIQGSIPNLIRSLPCGGDDRHPLGDKLD